MNVTVGTFNLNNLFSRWNFTGAIQALHDGGNSANVTVRYTFDDESTFRVRSFRGRLIREKQRVEAERVAARIRTMDVDVLAVQEVENVGVLRQFNRDHLGGMYQHQLLIEGNDPRFIDVGLLSKLPLGGATSHQTAVHDSDPGQRIFGRDLLEVEVLSSGRTIRLFTLFVNHLKSHFVPRDQDPLTGAQAANTRRERQAEVVAEIVEASMRPDSRYIVLGDMNDPPDSVHLQPFTAAPGLGLVNALVAPRETREAKAEATGNEPASAAWTYRHKESGEPPQHLLYDQIWLSPSLAVRQRDAVIDRRQRHGGDGSDHDPAWVSLEL